MTNKYLVGMTAGLVATIALSVLMAMKAAMGVMPDLNVIAMLTGMANGMMGTPANPMVGWMLHFVIGTVVWGVLFAGLHDVLPGSTDWQKGMVFGVAAWVLMMIGPMPMAGAGLFGMGMGMMAPVMTLVLHLIFGAVLGAVYKAASPA
jgi:Family of unknown function (DUF6789)